SAGSLGSRSNGGTPKPTAIGWPGRSGRSKQRCTESQGSSSRSSRSWQECRNERLNAGSNKSSCFGRIRAVSMNRDLISLVRCPRCRGDLAMEGNSPRDLVCRSCAATVSIVGSVPRLAGDSYAASFGRQWNRYDVARPEEDEATFRVKTGIAASELAGRWVLDAGCGGGRYARLVGVHGARG